MSHGSGGVPGTRIKERRQKMRWEGVAAERRRPEWGILNLLSLR